MVAAPQTRLATSETTQHHCTTTSDLNAVVPSNPVGVGDIVWKKERVLVARVDEDARKLLHDREAVKVKLSDDAVEVEEGVGGRCGEDTDASRVYSGGCSRYRFDGSSA